MRPPPIYVCCFTYKMNGETYVVSAKGSTASAARLGVAQALEIEGHDKALCVVESIDEYILPAGDV